MSIAVIRMNCFGSGTADLPNVEVIKLKKQLKIETKIHKAENAIASKLSMISGYNISALFLVMCEV